MSPVAIVLSKLQPYINGNKWLISGKFDWLHLELNILHNCTWDLIQQEKFDRFSANENQLFPLYHYANNVNTLICFGW